MADSDPSSSSAIRRWALVVRAVAGRNVQGESSKRVKVALRVAIGESVKRTSFEDVMNGRVRWNEELVFLVADPSSDNTVIELSLLRNPTSNFSRLRAPQSTYVAGRAFADVGSEQHIGWFPLSGKEDIKLSIFWRVMGDDTLDADIANDAQRKSASPSLRKMLMSGSGMSRSSSASGGLDLARSDGLRKALTPSEIIYSLDMAASSTIIRRAKLSLILHAGRGLRPVNLGGKSDPFAIVAIRGSRKKTRVIKNTLEPVWTDAAFTFGEVEDLDDQDEIHIVVKDWDPLGRFKDLGQLVITMSQILEITEREGPITNQWFHLAPTIYMPDRFRQVDLGSIQISVSFIGKQNVVLPASPLLHTPPGHPVSPGATALAPSVLPITPARTAVTPAPNSAADEPCITPLSTNTITEKPKLFVRLIQARNLFASDFGGTSDPYAVLKCRSETKRTSSCRKTLTPSYDFEAIFGEKDYIQENDELIVRFYDQDSVISDIVDDELGSVRIPMWSLLLDETVSMEAAMAEPRWYALEPFNSKQKCAGEVQLALYYSNPAAKKKDIYKGKVWLFELQATILTARHLGSMSMDPHARIKPYCTISCGRKDRWKTNAAPNGVNPTWSERFRFRHSADASSEREGIQKTDVLKIAVFNSVTSECLGKLSVDVVYIMDRLGYLDLQGKAFTGWFDLIPASTEDAVEKWDEEALDDEQQVDGEHGTDDGEESIMDTRDGSSTGLTSVRHHAKKLGEVLRKRLTGPASMKRSHSSSASGASTPVMQSPATSIGDLRPEPSDDSLLSLDERVTKSITDEKVKSTPKGQIRLTLRLVPIGETRMKNKRKLAVYVDEGCPAASKDLETPLPPLIYLKCRVGFDSKTSSPVPLYYNVQGGRPRFHCLLGFEEEIDWLLDAAIKRRATEEKQLRRYRHASGGDVERARELLRRGTPAPQDTIVISVHDAASDQQLCECKTTFVDAICGKRLLDPIPLSLDCQGRVPLTIRGWLKLVDIKEEMVPLLGHIYVRLLSYKSVLTPRFDQSLRFVVRYSDRVVASKAVVGDPFPDLTLVFGSEPFRFPVYNAFKNVSVEVWQVRLPGAAADATESNQAIALAKSVLSGVFKRSDSGAASESSMQEPDAPIVSDAPAKASSSRWGTLLGSASLTLFDLVEIEAQTVFEEDGVSLGIREKAFKMRVRDKTGKEVGSLWMEGRYAESLGGVLSPNPNPPAQESKPFSLANFRHEVNRLVKVVGFLTAFGAHVGSLLNWDSPTKTVSTIVAITVVCSVDWFSSRWLLIFPFCALIHMVNRHRLRTNGMLLSEFEETDEGEEGLSAEVRIACVGARQAHPQVSKPWKKVHAQVSLLARPGKQAKIMGTTRVDPRVENGEVDFVSSKVGYTVHSSVKARPSVQMWKFSETLPPVPSFSFRAENFTVLKDTILVVTLFSARNLIAADSNGLSDPFAKIFVKDASTGHVAGDVIRSAIRFKTLNPLWNERFILGEKKAVVASNVLVLDFYDSDIIATSNDPLGCLELDLAQINSLFPSPRDLYAITPEERAIRGRRWFPLAPPRGATGKRPPPRSPGLSVKERSSEYGEVCVHVEWMSVHGTQLPQRPKDAAPLVRMSSEASDAANVEEETDGEDEQPLDTWTRCGAQVAVDLFDQRDTFLGRALVPLGSIVSSDETRVQPQVELELPLFRKFDGSKDDVKIGEDTLRGADQDGARGFVKLRMMVTLPDPKAKERRMAIMEAKRADRSNAFQKMRMITKHLASVQDQLAAVNSRAERLKNLFNWTHPRRTELMFNLMLFLSILFILIPSRFFILMVVLFFFTEKFRPMGTMGARFKHLLSQLPTDDDLRAVVQGDGASGKRKYLTNTVHKSKQRLRLSASSSEGSQSLVRRSSSAGGVVRMSTALGEPANLTKKEMALKLQNINAGDAIFFGHLSFARLPRKIAQDENSALAIKSLDFSRRFFILSNVGLHYWVDREAVESTKAMGHFVPLTAVMDEDVPDIAGCEKRECFFVVESEKEKIIFMASSGTKKNAWVDVIRAHGPLVE